jgi:hypothetical protein
MRIRPVTVVSPAPSPSCLDALGPALQSAEITEDYFVASPVADPELIDTQKLPTVVRSSHLIHQHTYQMLQL